MFTGIITGLGRIVDAQSAATGKRLTVQAPAGYLDDVQHGDSIAINGCCLTVVELNGADMAFEAGAETLSRTNLGRLQPAPTVNLEASLRLGDSLGGHLVAGHVDAVGHLESPRRRRPMVDDVVRRPARTHAPNGVEGLDRHRRRQPHAGRPVTDSAEGCEFSH